VLKTQEAPPILVTKNGDTALKKPSFSGRSAHFAPLIFVLADLSRKADILKGNP
jgi:hypothetical protein